MTHKQKLIPYLFFNEYVFPCYGRFVYLQYSLISISAALFIREEIATLIP